MLASIQVERKMNSSSFPQFSFLSAVYPQTSFCATVYCTAIFLSEVSVSACRDWWAERIDEIANSELASTSTWQPNW